MRHFLRTIVPPLVQVKTVLATAHQQLHLLLKLLTLVRMYTPGKFLNGHSTIRQQVAAIAVGKAVVSDVIFHQLEITHA